MTEGTHVLTMATEVPSNNGETRTMRIVTILTTLLVAMTACDLGTGPEDAGSVGIIEVQRENSSQTSETDDPLYPVDITAPDTVTVGEPFAVVVTTYGLSGCWEPRGESVSVDGIDASVTPFDVDTRGQPGRDVCTAAITPLNHTFNLQFDQAGEGMLRVDGRRIQGQEEETAEPLQAEISIVVQPAAS